MIITSWVYFSYCTVLFSVNHGVFYQDVTCLQFMCELLGGRTTDLRPDTNLGAVEILKLENNLKGMKFLTNHCGEKRRLKCQAIGDAPNIHT